MHFLYLVETIYKLHYVHALIELNHMILLYNFASRSQTDKLRNSYVTRSKIFYKINQVIV